MRVLEGFRWLTAKKTLSLALYATSNFFLLSPHTVVAASQITIWGVVGFFLCLWI